MPQNLIKPTKFKLDSIIFYKALSTPVIMNMTLIAMFGLLICLLVFVCFIFYVQQLKQHIICNVFCPFKLYNELLQTVILTLKAKYT